MAPRAAADAVKVYTTVLILCDCGQRHLISQEAQQTTITGALRAFEARRCPCGRSFAACSMIACNVSKTATQSGA